MHTHEAKKSVGCRWIVNLLQTFSRILNKIYCVAALLRRCRERFLVPNENHDHFHLPVPLTKAHTRVLSGQFNERCTIRDSARSN
eukprot:scaffold2215_cov191-Alexandrium_tamarense.AAC.15